MGFDSRQGQETFLFPRDVQTGFGIHAAVYIGVLGPVEGGWPERDVSHSFTSNAEFKNEWSYTSTPPVCLHGLDRDNFSFLLLSFNL